MREIVQVDLPEDRTLAVREQPEFLQLTTRLRRLLENLLRKRFCGSIPSIHPVAYGGPAAVDTETRRSGPSRGSIVSGVGRILPMLGILGLLALWLGGDRGVRREVLHRSSPWAVFAKRFMRSVAVLLGKPGNPPPPRRACGFFLWKSCGGWLSHGVRAQQGAAGNLLSGSVLIFNAVPLVGQRRQFLVLIMETAWSPRLPLRPGVLFPYAGEHGARPGVGEPPGDGKLMRVLSASKEGDFSSACGFSTRLPFLFSALPRCGFDEAFVGAVVGEWVRRQ